MKNYILLLMIAISALSSCKTYYSALGTSESDFLQKNKVRLIEAHDNVAVYKKQQDPAWHFRPETKFYYFVNGKLVAINEGERMPDIIVEKRNR